MSRETTYNFSAGPATLPREVLQEVQAECLDWQHGMSVMEFSHRSAEFLALTEQAEQDLRQLLSLPDNYRALFLPGGATAQFAMVPLNLLAAKKKALYVDSGHWSQKAIKEAQRYCQVELAYSAEKNGFTDVAAVREWQLDDEAAYLHVTSNETINGVKITELPKTPLPIVADMSSMFLSEQHDVSQYAIIYAGAQKNLGPAGLTLVIIREDLLGFAKDSCPGILNYKNHADAGSMFNTPATFNWYVMAKVFAWLKKQGGLAVMQQRNQAKADLLYQTIDQSDFYSNTVTKSCRSMMNVPFTLANEQLEEQFLADARAENLYHLRGHRSVGGMRASIYNAMPQEGVQALVDFMCYFAAKRG